MQDINVLIDKVSDGPIRAATVGLNKVGYPELLVEFHDSSLTDQAKEFLLNLSNYTLQNGITFRAGETMAYGYWLVKFSNAGEHDLEIWEYNAPATEFVKGANLTLNYWKEQHSVCTAYGADFIPPRPDQLSVVSEGVFEGLPVQGVRYPSPDHMSGWWITTDKYDGDINSLKNEHTYHLTATRPDLAKYLALPAGFRFDFASHEDIWFDDKVAQGGE